MQYQEVLHEPFQDYYYFDRDISWLFFNERVLIEAEREQTPLLERINFLSIFSSNLDEFYRVRMPALAAIHKLHQKDKLEKEEAERHADVAKTAKDLILQQQNRFGQVLNRVLPQLEQNGIVVYYNRPFPVDLAAEISHYFYTEVLAFLQPWYLSRSEETFFPENNQLYLAVTGRCPDGKQEVVVVNIPTEHLSRFYKIEANGRQQIIFLDDIIKAHLDVLPDISIEGSYSFKVTRDAELNLDDEYEGDIAEKIERQIAKRDFGLATRFLHEPNLPEEARQLLLEKLKLSEDVMVAGGRYHNLKDLSSLPVSLPALKYEKWPAARHPSLDTRQLLNLLQERDIMIHTPYHAYDAVLRFFNEAAIHADVEQIYLTMYRVASDSRIINALLAAAHNGKKVTVLIELKARFDEANNIKWAKRLKKAGVHVLYTPAELKVHAKIALVKGKIGSNLQYAGLLATGNLNEGTARFYTDHILMTSNAALLEEVEKLFRSFEQKQKKEEKVDFSHLLVAQHNLQDRFLELIDREIFHARTGAPARIIIKLNNLEERVLINKLYAASNAGVQVDLIVRSICCLVPGIKGMSENIRIRRIVDRFLEHGRVYIFQNNGSQEVYLGSADWMNRNIYRRVEVCFPVVDEGLKQEILQTIDLQLMDNTQAVDITTDLQNLPVVFGEQQIRSQYEIYKMLTRQ